MNRERWMENNLRAIEEAFAGEEIEPILANIGRWEASKANRIRKNWKIKQKGGKIMGRKDRTPFGWTPDPKDDRKMIPHRKEQLTLQLIKELHERGLTPGKICKALDAAGRDRRGHSWDGARGTITAILKRL